MKSYVDLQFYAIDQHRLAGGFPVDIISNEMKLLQIANKPDQYISHIGIFLLVVPKYTCVEG